MPVTARLQHLEKRRRLWVARLRVPDDLVAKLGRRWFSWSTGEADPLKAAIKARPVIEGWKAQIESAKAGQAPTSPTIPDDLVRSLRTAWRDGNASLVVDSLLDLLPPSVTLADLTRAWEARDRDPGLALADAAPVVAKVLDQIANTPFGSFKADWLASLERAGMKDRQRDQYARDVDLFGSLSVAGLTKEAVQGWVDRRLTEDSAKTVQRRLAALRGYWTWMQRQGHAPAEADPFKGLRVEVDGRRPAPSKSRRSFTVAELQALYRAAEGKDQPLADLIWLAAHTGARIEELCNLTTKDVAGGALRIVDSKTEAGRRDVPVVAQIEPVVARLVADSRDGYLVPSTADNQYGERSVPLGKRFGRLKASLGHGPDLVFHSIRKTVATLLQDAGCPEHIAADILGHEITTMSYGVYSTGSSLGTRREWLEKALVPLGGEALS